MDNYKVSNCIEKLNQQENMFFKHKLIYGWVKGSYITQREYLEILNKVFGIDISDCMKEYKY